MSAPEENSFVFPRESQCFSNQSGGSRSDIKCSVILTAKSLKRKLIHTSLVFHRKNVSILHR